MAFVEEFTHCPRCGSEEIEDTDYEAENGQPEEGIWCESCGWEGSDDELVSGD